MIMWSGGLIVITAARICKFAHTKTPSRTENSTLEAPNSDSAIASAQAA